MCFFPGGMQCCKIFWQYGSTGCRIFKEGVKFVFSNVTKIDKFFTVDQTLCSKCKMMVKISSIFVAFLENTNFIKLDVFLAQELICSKEIIVFCT